MVVITSCREDFTCECTADNEEFNINQTANMTQVAAEDWCDELNQDNEFDGEEIEGWECRLK